jgi:hypothetical protein
VSLKGGRLGEDVNRARGAGGLVGVVGVTLPSKYIPSWGTNLSVRDWHHNGAGNLNMPSEGPSLVQQLQALIQSVLDSLSRSREVITRLDSTRPPKPPGAG